MSVDREAPKAANQGGRMAGPAATERDRLVLAKVGHHYGATYWVLSHWLSSDSSPLSESAVRQQVQRWLRLGLIAKQSLLGRMWVTLTRRGYDFVGQTYALWSMPLTRLTHVEAVAAVRTWYEASPSRIASQGRWISERELFARRGDFGAHAWHVSDAEVRLPGADSSTAMEIELHRKQPASRYVDEVFGRLRSDVRTVVYLCPKQLVQPVRASVEAAVVNSGVAARVSVVVRPLPSEAQGRLEGGAR